MLNEFEFQNRKVAIYARVSTEHEAQIQALDNQLDWYKPILTSHPEWELYRQYVDEGITGTSADKRPEFMQMIKDAKNHKFDLIITRETSRFARNTVDTLQYTRELRRCGVEVYFINDGIKTFDGDGELRLTILASLSQEESRKTSQRVKAGQQTSMLNGVIYGNGNVLGYDLVDKKLIINPEQAAIVRLIYDMYLDGNGMPKIRQELERRGCKTATGKTKWYDSVISHVLKNTLYCGIITYHKEYVPDYLVQKKVRNYGAIDQIQVQGTHEPIVSVEEFERVQKILKSKTKDLKINPDGSRNLTGKGLPKDVWGKLMRCQCGHALNRSYYGKNGNKERQLAYQCREVVINGKPENRKKKGLPWEGYCNTPMVAQWKLQLMAKVILKKYLADRDEVLRVANEIIAAHYNDRPKKKEDRQRDTLVKSKQAELEKYEKRFDQLLEMRSDGEITAEMFAKKGREFQARIDTLREEIRKLQPEESCLPPVEYYKDKIEVLSYALEQYTNISDDTTDDIPESVIEAFVKKIIVCEDHFEWYLRLGSGTDGGDAPVNLKIEGKKDKTTVISTDNGGLSQPIYEHGRQLLRSRGNNPGNVIVQTRLSCFVQS